MAFQRGNIVLVPFPFTDQSTTKVRPAVVVSSRLYNTSEPDIVLAAISTQLLSATGSLDYVLADWQSSGLRFASAFKPVFTTLDPSLVLHTIGSLSAVDMAEVDQRLRLAFEL
jgi:mRNA interferase MazF